jgi:hypothetical protein
VSAERRIFHFVEIGGFLPKAATQKKQGADFSAPFLFKLWNF